jgi:hypothetical protein
MQNSEIITRLSQITDSTSVVYSITTKEILHQIVHRMGNDALSLSQSDLELAREEVQATINHSLDYRLYIDEGLDVWQITRQL